MKMHHSFNIFSTEYLALFLSIIAICVNVYISWKDRKHTLAKEEYFKLQQTVEKIDAKLLFLNTHREKLRIFFELSHSVYGDQNSVFVDSNDTFNKSIFEKNGEEITALIDIYFPSIGEDWNFCLEEISKLFTLVFVLSKNIENKKIINWDEEARNFNTINQNLGEKPKEISDRLKIELKKFREESLK